MLIAVVSTVLTFRFPIYSGNRPFEMAPVDSFFPQLLNELNAQSSVWITILTGLNALIALVCIFLFKNRSLQVKLCYLGIFLSVVLLILYFLEIQDFTAGNLTLWSVFYFLILISFILAARGIAKDQKLIRSMYRLR
jgi:hypothetical protein